MKVACEHVVRCGNGECYHNRDGVTCSLKVVVLDTTGKCAFIRPKTKVVSAFAVAPSRSSNAC